MVDWRAVTAVLSFVSHENAIGSFIIIYVATVIVRELIGIVLFFIVVFIVVLVVVFVGIDIVIDSDLL